MKIIIRADASIFFGSGHVVRCLALAEQLRLGGAEVGFITCNFEGNLNNLIKKQEFNLYELSAARQKKHEYSSRAEFESLFREFQEVDIEETVTILKETKPDWLIIDHYYLDSNWAIRMRPYAKKIMVIDDLANRDYECDVLLDQNYFSEGYDRYTNLVPLYCTQLLGPCYALLRRQFGEAHSNLRFRDGEVSRLLVFFGGSDRQNVTSLALEALSTPELDQVDVDVVLGSANPYRKQIAKLVRKRPRTSLHVQVDNMAGLICDADLALCAGGSSTWERLCLGLPSVVVTTADNQEPFTRDLHEDGLIRCLGNSMGIDVQELRKGIIQAFGDSEWNLRASAMGPKIVDGNGAERAANFLFTAPSTETNEIVRT